MDPSEPDGVTSAPTPHPNLSPSMAPAGAVTKGRLQSLEQNLLVLERNYGATHPQVGSPCSVASVLRVTAAITLHCSEASLRENEEVMLYM